jgi:hypothetical protein
MRERGLRARVSRLYRRGPGMVRRFFAKNGGDWPIVLDPRGSIGVEFGVNKVPETWIISPSGVVVFRTISTVRPTR